VIAELAELFVSSVDAQALVSTPLTRLRRLVATDVGGWPRAALPAPRVVALDGLVELDLSLPRPTWRGPSDEAVAALVRRSPALRKLALAGCGSVGALTVCDNAPCCCSRGRKHATVTRRLKSALSWAVRTSITTRRGGGGLVVARPEPSARRKTTRRRQVDALLVAAPRAPIGALDARGTRLDDAAVARLAAGAPRLRSLRVGGSAYLTPLAVAWLTGELGVAPACALTELDLSDARLNGPFSTIAPLMVGEIARSLPALRRLALESGATLNEGALDALAGLSRLDVLTLNSCN